MSNRSAIETPIGILKGRDSVWLESLVMEPPSQVVLNLVVLGAGVVQSPRDTIHERTKLTVSFSGVGAIQVMELETWEAQEQDPLAFATSSFELVDQSRWIAELSDPSGEYQPMVKANNQHMELLTYDHVISVICERFQIESSGDNAG